MLWKRCFYFYLFFSVQFLSAQEKSFQFGIQTGVNLSSILSEKRSDNLVGSQFLGLSFGMVARQKLTTTKHYLGRLKGRLDHFLETGINGVRQGFEFEFEGQRFFKEFYHFQIPILWVFKPKHTALSSRYFKKNKIFFWTKTGFVLSFHSIQNERRDLNIEGRANPIYQELERKNTAQSFWYGAIGVQKEHKNGAISGVGISILSAWSPLFTSKIYEKNQIPIENSNYNRNGSYLSLDWQYFFGNKQKQSLQHKKIIYNPRFL